VITESGNGKQYRPAHNRFLKPVTVNFPVHELRYPGPVTAASVADESIRIFEENAPQRDRLKHGQMLWNAPDKNTGGDSPERKYKPVILSVITGEEVALFEQGKPVKAIRKQTVARIMKEACQQGGYPLCRGCRTYFGPTRFFHFCCKNRIRKRNENRIAASGRFT
jgi:hypothetical protein